MSFRGNPEHLAKLKLGAEAWNRWRKENPDIKPDLYGADLQRANLNGSLLQRANLQRANLEEADLRGANLQRADLQYTSLKKANLQNVNLANGKLTKAKLQKADLERVSFYRANLREAILCGANLSRANLKQANLIEANLQKVNFSGANLQECDLWGAKLMGANLQEAVLLNANLRSVNLRGAQLQRAKVIGADLRRAILKKTNLMQADLTSSRFSQAVFISTVLKDVDLSEAMGLNECNHLGPSVIDLLTLEKSKALPLEFLEGVGLSEDFIRAFAKENSITIEFTHKLWGQLLPIEAALTATLGSRYIAEKSFERITVKLESPEHFQLAMDAVAPTLAAIHKTEPGCVKSVETTSTGDQNLSVSGQPLQIILEDISQKLDSLIEQDNKGLSSKMAFHEKAIVKSVEGGVQGLAAIALQWWFESAEKLDERIISPVCLAIYGNYLSIINRIKATISLREDSNQVLPRHVEFFGEDDETEQNNDVK